MNNLCNCKNKKIEHIRPMVEVKTDRVFKPEPNVEYEFWEHYQRATTRPFCKSCGKEVSLNFFRDKNAS